ncbi:MAG TPA: NAD(P)-dependent glycerol-3-phosphate dehydrogenase [Clostridiales bacterium]|nr:NAD(P)-dependent glycerol-3-phosphate dehydrogenase [Clostridiales bacterium]
MVNIGIIGAGSWAGAIAILLNNNGHKVEMWSHDQSIVDVFNETRQLKNALPDMFFDESIEISTDLERVSTNKDVIVVAVASPFVRSTVTKAKAFMKDKQIIVNCSKGIEDSSLKTLTDVILELVPNSHVAVLSGPSHAEEVSKSVPTTVVVGASDKVTAKFLQDVFMNENFRVYTSNDLLGIEIGAALKNVIALAAGTSDGLGFGDNTKAALMTRGIAEITRLGIAMGGNPETFAGLSGMGDLIVTCSSKHSRNRMAGYYIGKGYTAKEAMDKVQQVVEGANSAKAALALAKKYNVEMPIVEQINLVLFEDKNPKEAVSNLLLRNKKEEF